MNDRTIRRIAVPVLIGCLWTGLLSAQEPLKADSPESGRTSWMDKVPRLDPIDPYPPEQIRASIERGIQYLLDSQNHDGSWGSATKTKGLNIYAPIPGAHHAFRTGVTSLCIAALAEMQDERPEVVAAIDKGEAWLIENLPSLRRATGDAIYNVWGHCYAITALVKLHQRHADEPERQKVLVDLIKLQFDKLDRYESVDGGWGYYDFRYQTAKPSSSSISFVNAAVLVAFHEAKLIGVEPPEKIVKRAIASTRRQLLPEFNYLYGEYLKWQPARGINRAGGSLGRSQACNLALHLWGGEDVTIDVMTAWQHRLYARNGWLDIGRKRPIPHESWFQVAGYFYYFGHYYAALTFELLPPESRAEFRPHMTKLMLDRQEKDGSWWDYPLYDYHQPYGTSYALMILTRCLPDENL
ncbi:MAG TPA: hypothetical protein VMM56_15350 [Planctomycetaceae bacterium]|nr:hypothetical protein [Planctomycetaceae bacterium]